MRELKFRAWDKNKKKMIYDFLISSNSEIFVIREPFGNKNGYNITDLIPCIDDVIIMQYTGLKDKNEKEIYEGDIVSYFTKVKINGKIQFNSTRSQFEIFWKFGDIFSLDEHFLKNEIVVVGNIYEKNKK